MRIGIDGFALERDFSGIEVYVKHLVDGLVENNFDLELYSYAHLERHNYQGILKTSAYTNINFFKKLYWNQIGITKLHTDNIDIFHSPAFSLPYLISRKFKKVVTVHDFAFLRYPQFFDRATKLYYKLILERSLKKADKIICISKSCQEDLDYFFPKFSAKSVVVYNGFQDFSKISANEEIIERLKVKKKKYLLTVGTLNPRKNINNTIKAFLEIKKVYPDYKLVIVGKDGEKIKAEWNNLDNSIIFTGYITNNDLAALYKHASAFMFLSFYEGFGFPLLEAMSSGIPVILSNSSSLKEISGYSDSLLCNPHSISDIVEKALIILDPANMEIINKSPDETLNKFSWNKMVSETIHVYQSL